LIESIDLDAPVELLDALLFVVNIMLEQLIVRASERVLALAAVTVTLKLEGSDARHVRTVRPALPTNDRAVWLKLLHLDLEAHPPQAAILVVVLEAEPGQTSKVQMGLFSPQLPEPSRLDVTLARIAAIVGEGNAGKAVLRDTHAQDSFRIEPFQAAPMRARELSRIVARPVLRRLRPAEIISVELPDRTPHSFTFRQLQYVVENAYGPWLSSGEWWNPLLWGYEQWDIVARAQVGEMLCCCILRDVVSNRWQMDALYD
jgi:protein ImuB